MMCIEKLLLTICDNKSTVQN